MGARSPLLAAFGDDFSWSLLDAAPDGCVIASETGEIAFVNDHVLGLLGYEPAELLGRPIEMLLPEDVRTVHRAHRTRYRADPTPRTMGADRLLRARRSDGSVFPVEVSLSPLRLGGALFVVAGLRDVTARLDAEDHLRRVLHTLDATDDAVFIFDVTSLRFSYVNDGAVRLVGYSHDELLTMSPLHLDAKGTDASYRSLVEELRGDLDLALRRETTLLRRDGTEVPVEKTFKYAPTGRDGAQWIIALARDSTERLRAEQELQRSHDALRQAEQVMAVAEDRERIARDLHDTVIQRLFGAGLNLQGTMAAVDEHARDRLAHTIDELDTTIKELRMAIFALQGSGAAPGGLRGRLLDVITDQTESMGFEPRLQFDGPIETIETTIAEHLVPVLREALSNVARHADARSVRVSLTVAELVTLLVVDDGIGVPDQVLGGRGVGNLATRAEELGGRFVLEPDPSGGTRMLWEVPANPVATSSHVPTTSDVASSS